MLLLSGDPKRWRRRRARHRSKGDTGEECECSADEKAATRGRCFTEPCVTSDHHGSMVRPKRSIHRIEPATYRVRAGEIRTPDAPAYGPESVPVDDAC